MSVLSRLPGSGFEVARAAVGWAAESAAALVTIPLRVFRVLAAVELLINRITLVVDEAEALVRRTGTVVGEAEGAVTRVAAVSAAAEAAVREAGAVAATAAAVVDDARRVSRAAETVVAGAGTAAGEAGALLAAYGPTLRTAAPMAREFVRQLSAEEVSAAIRLVDELPRLLDHLTTDVLPILGTLERVGPDVHALLDTTRDLKLAVAGIPGLKMLMRRGEERIVD